MPKALELKQNGELLHGYVISLMKTLLSVLVKLSLHSFVFLVESTKEPVDRGGY